MLHDTEYEKFKASILALGPIVPGTLRKVYLRCGNKNCHCKADNRKNWHGPYTFWDRKEGKKLSSRSIPSKQVHVIRGWIYNRRDLMRIVRRMLKHGVKMADQIKILK